MRARERRGFIVVAAVAAGVLALASAAVACIPYKGKMEVKGIGEGATEVEVTGSNRGMTYCASEPYGPSATLPNSVPGAGQFSVKLKPYLGNRELNPTEDCTGRLAGINGVRFWSGSATPLGTSSADFRCFPWDAGSVKVGELVVDASGVAEGVFPIPADAAPGYGAVCVINTTNGGLFGGNRAPILLL